MKGLPDGSSRTCIRAIQDLGVLPISKTILTEGGFTGRQASGLFASLQLKGFIEHGNPTLSGFEDDPVETYLVIGSLTEDVARQIDIPFDTPIEAGNGGEQEKHLSKEEQGEQEDGGVQSHNPPHASHSSEVAPQPQESLNKQEMDKEPCQKNTELFQNQTLNELVESFAEDWRQWPDSIEAEMKGYSYRDLTSKEGRLLTLSVEQVLKKESNNLSQLSLGQPGGNCLRGTRFSDSSQNLKWEVHLNGDYSGTLYVMALRQEGGMV